MKCFSFNLPRASSVMPEPPRAQAAELRREDQRRPWAGTYVAAHRKICARGASFQWSPGAGRAGAVDPPGGETASSGPSLDTVPLVQAPMENAGGRLTPGRSGRDEIAQLVEALRADPGDRFQLIDAYEGTVLPAVVEDLLRSDRADTGQRVEIFDGRRVQAHRARKGGRRAAASKTDMKSTRPGIPSSASVPR